MPIEKAFVSFDCVEGDSWNYQDHGGRQRAVCLFSVELIEELKKEGYELYPGAMGENFTTEGLDYRKIRIGDVFQVGNEVQIKINRIRIPCGNLDVYGETLKTAIYDSQVKQGNVETFNWGRSGYKCEVLKEGMVQSGDEIVKIG